MRFMVIIKATEDSEAGVLPSPKLLEEMTRFNEELVKAGVLLEGEGLHPSAKGKRVRFSGARRTVMDGPFSETKELVAGYWLWQCRSMEEAVEWVKRCRIPTTRRPRSRSGLSLRRRTSARISLPSWPRRSVSCGAGPKRNAAAGDAPPLCCVASDQLVDFGPVRGARPSRAHRDAGAIASMAAITWPGVARTR